MSSDEAAATEFWVRRMATIARCRRNWRRQVLSRPIPCWWVTVTRGDDGWR